MGSLLLGFFWLLAGFVGGASSTELDSSANGLTKSAGGFAGVDCGVVAILNRGLGAGGAFGSGLGVSSGSGDPFSGVLSLIGVFK